MLITHNSEVKIVVLNVRADEKQAQTAALLTLLTLLAIGSQEIEEGKFRTAAELFAALN